MTWYKLAKNGDCGHWPLRGSIILVWNEKSMKARLVLNLPTVDGTITFEEEDGHRYVYPDTPYSHWANIPIPG